MSSATGIIDRMVSLGMIPADCKDVAVRELHRELLRRSQRTAAVLASSVSMMQVALHVARRSM